MAAGPGTAQANFTPQTIGMAMLLSRIVEQVGYARTSNPAEFADWLAKLHSDVTQDIDGLRFPGVDPKVAAEGLNAMKGTVKFVLGRCAIKSDS